MWLKRQLIAEWFLLLVPYFIDQLFGEIVLKIESLIHNSGLVHHKCSTWNRIFKDIFRRRLNDVDKGDCICDLNLDSKYSVSCRIGHLPQNYSLGALLDTQLAWPSPKVYSIIICQLYHLWLGFVLPNKRHSLVGLQSHGIDGLYLANFDKWFRSIRKHILWSDLNNSSEFIDVFILYGRQVRV